MPIYREIVAAEIRAAGDGLGDDQVEVVMSTGVIARDGHILEPEGADLATYLRNPIILWQHNPNHPVGTAEEVVVDGNKIRARIRFAPLGISVEADRTRGLVKAGIINAVSVGFDPIDGAPLDPKRPKGGQRFSKWELLECSFVSIPADTGAVVTAREHIQETEMTEQTPAVEATPAKPAKAVIVRAHPAGVGIHIRGLYDIGRLAWLLDDLCYAHYCAEIETAFEGDESAVPAMIAKAMQDVGAALIAMTEEEVAEALAGTYEDEDDGAGLDGEATTVILAAAKPGLKRFLTGKFRAQQIATRAGKKHSAATLGKMQEALGEHDDAMKSHRAALRAHQRAANCIRSMIDESECDCDPEDPDCDCEEEDRAVGNGEAQEGSKTVQTSSGTAESKGSDNGRSARQREIRELELRGLARSTAA